MPIPSSYWGIQLPDGYIPVSRETADLVLRVLREVKQSPLALPPAYVQIESLIGSTRYVVLDHVLEVFESTPENRDANREFERMIDEERKLFKSMYPEWSSDND